MSEPDELVPDRAETGEVNLEIELGVLAKDRPQPAGEGQQRQQRVWQVNQREETGRQQHALPAGAKNDLCASI